MMVVWKGAPALSLDNLSAGTIIAAIFGVIGVTVLITLLLFYPFLYRRLVMEDWTLRWYRFSWSYLIYRYHLFLGPFLWKRGPVPHCPEEQRIVVQNYYRGHLTKEELEARDASLRLYREATELGERMSAHISPKSLPVYPPVSKPPSSSAGSRSSASSPSSLTSIPQRLSPDENNKTSNTTSQNSHGPVVNYCKTVIWPTIRKVVLHGVDQDIVQLQQRDSRHVRTKRLERMHSRAAHYDNQTEHLFSFLQVLTASTQSFAHGYLPQY
jgi:solute carrier family 20 (sodium-dependent phosphate transporter)